MQNRRFISILATSVRFFLIFGRSKTLYFKVFWGLGRFHIYSKILKSTKNVFENVVVTERVLWWFPRPVEQFPKGHDPHVPNSIGCSVGAGVAPLK